MRTTKAKKIDGRKNNGGHENSGRKTQTDLAIPVTAYIKKSRVKELGGIENARMLSKDYLETAKIILPPVKGFGVFEK